MAAPQPGMSQEFGNTSVDQGSLSFQGNVNGDVHLHQRSEIPPSPTAIIPFGRDFDFVQRDIILDRVHKLCAEASARVALVGLGGVGKSQIAIEYAYRIREQQPETWVFWVHASNAARYEQSFRATADLVRIPGRQDPQNNIFQLVGNWLQGGKSGKWVVILDNVDQAGFLLSPPQSHPEGPPLISYLPYCSHGSILVTSRNRDVALRLVEARHLIPVGPMDQTDAVNLIERKLGKLDASEDVRSAEALAKALEYMPLAIVQATSYIQQRAPRSSLQRYLEDFERSDRKKASLLDFEGGHLRRDREASNSIMLTWQISFDYLRETRPSAADLLSLMSFCDRQGIPECLLRERDDEEKEQAASSSDSDSSSSSDEDFEQDISALRDFAFISTNGDGTTFEVHRLVQLVTRKWLKEQGQQEKWQHKFIRRLSTELPNGEYENWEKWRSLLPQAKSAAALRPKDNQASLLDWASVLYLMAWYLERAGRLKEALQAAEDAMQVRTELLGREHKRTLEAISIVGDNYSRQGAWHNAEKLRVEVLDTRRKKLGLNHLDTLTSMDNLALTYRHQGRYEAAEELQVEVLEIRKKKLGLDHPGTLTSMGNLASTYWHQGRYEAAEELEVEVLEVRKKKLGLDHPDTLSSMDNLAFTKHALGQYSAAISLMKSCSQARTRVLGSRHPYSVDSATTLSEWEAEFVDGTSGLSLLEIGEDNSL